MMKMLVMLIGSLFLKIINENFHEVDYLKENLKLNTNTRYQEGNKILEFRAQGRNVREEI